MEEAVSRATPVHMKLYGCSAASWALAYVHGLADAFITHAELHGFFVGVTTVLCILGVVTLLFGAIGHRTD